MQNCYPLSLRFMELLKYMVAKSPLLCQAHKVYRNVISLLTPQLKMCSKHNVCSLVINKLAQISWSFYRNWCYAESVLKKKINKIVVLLPRYSPLSRPISSLQS